MIDWINTNWIEITGVIFMLLFLYLEIMQKWTMWILGIISGLFYVYINFTNGLYSLAVLMSYNVICSIYGLYCWKFAKTNNQNMPFSFIDTRLALRLTLIGVLVFEILAFTFMFINGSPFENAGTLFTFTLDIQITTLSVIALWMAARKIIECWYLWLVVNPCSIALYIYKGMYPSTILYVIYTICAVLGYIQWRKAALKQQ
jgi:nicotinamide mononucleotide transporter